MQNPNCRPQLSLSQIKTFVRLIDKGSGPKGFAKTLNLTLEDVRYYTKFLSYYRKYIETNKKIVELRKKNLKSEERQKIIGILRRDLENEYPKI